MAEYRQWREEKREWLKDVLPLDTPYNIKVEVSSLCNARCVYCAHSQIGESGVWQGNMSMELLEKIISDIKMFPRKPKLMEMYMFGEPLCNPNLAKMIKRVREENVVDRINFTTNGLLFTKDNIDEIIDAGVDVIRVSLQGLDAEAYKKNCRINIDFDAFINHLTYLYNHKKNCSIRMKIADLAIKDYPDGMEKFESMFGCIADSIFVETILPLYQQVDYSKVDSEIGNNILNGREGIATNHIHRVCHRPFYRMRVAANGLVTSACCDTPNDIVYGDINKESLVNIWNGKKHMNFLRMQLQGKRFEHSSCKNCVAANDITSKADFLDPWAEQILDRMKS